MTSAVPSAPSASGIVAGTRISRLISNARSTRSVRWSSSSGLRRYSYAPSRIASMAVSAVPCPVMKTTGIFGSSSWTRRNASSPDTPARSMSRMTTSGRSRPTAARPSAADAAVRSVTSGPGNARRKKWRIDGSSSTTSNFGMNSSGANAVPASGRGGQPQDEAGPPARQVERRQGPAVVLGDPPGHRHTEPDPGLLAADERLEHLRQDVAGDARPGVPDEQLDVPVPRGAEVGLHRPAVGHGVEGVEDQVQQQLLELVLVP